MLIPPRVIARSSAIVVPTICGGFMISSDSAITWVNKSWNSQEYQHGGHVQHQVNKVITDEADSCTDFQKGLKSPHMEWTSKNQDGN